MVIYSSACHQRYQGILQMLGQRENDDAPTITHWPLIPLLNVVNPSKMLCIEMTNLLLVQL
jgi:hypothetical protein